MSTPESLITTQVSVSGMTCGHCVSSVTEELEAVDGVERVAVDLNAGGISTVTISSAGNSPRRRSARPWRRPVTWSSQTAPEALSLRSRRRHPAPGRAHPEGRVAAGRGRRRRRSAAPGR